MRKKNNSKLLEEVQGSLNFPLTFLISLDNNSGKCVKFPSRPEHLHVWRCIHRFFFLAITHNLYLLITDAPLGNMTMITHKCRNLWTRKYQGTAPPNSPPSRVGCIFLSESKLRSNVKNTVIFCLFIISGGRGSKNRINEFSDWFLF